MAVPARPLEEVAQGPAVAKIPGRDTEVEMLHPLYQTQQQGACRLGILGTVGAHEVPRMGEVAETSSKVLIGLHVGGDAGDFQLALPTCMEVEVLGIERCEYVENPHAACQVVVKNDGAEKGEESAKIIDEDGVVQVADCDGIQPLVHPGQQQECAAAGCNVRAGVVWVGIAVHSRDEIASDLIKQLGGKSGQFHGAILRYCDVAML